jgi:hypothetical protein
VSKKKAQREDALVTNFAVYKQDTERVHSKLVGIYKSNAADAIKHAIVAHKIFPGDVAITVPLSSDNEGRLDSVRVMKHWAIYRRHGEIEAIPDRVGMMLTQTSYRYYREYLKYGRFKSAWYKIRRKK